MSLVVLDRPIAFHRCFVDLTGSITGALFLSQAIDWQRHCQSPDGFWCKTQEEWEEETGMSRRELESAREDCQEFIHWERRGVPAKTYYHLDLSEVSSRLAENATLNKSSHSNRFVPPTIEEVKSECRECGLPQSQAEQFWYYYDSVNWFVGKKRMVRWKSSLARWASDWRSKQPRAIEDAIGSKIRSEARRTLSNGKPSEPFQAQFNLKPMQL